MHSYLKRIRRKMKKDNTPAEQERLKGIYLSLAEKVNLDDDIVKAIKAERAPKVAVPAKAAPKAVVAVPKPKAEVKVEVKPEPKPEVKVEAKETKPKAENKPATSWRQRNASKRKSSDSETK